MLFAPSRPVKWFSLDRNHTRTDGDDRYAAKNPEHGATLTYFLKDSLLTAKQKRQQAEKKMVKDEKYPKYPSWESIEKENQEAKPAVYLEINDAEGNFVNRIQGKTSKGLHRITWNMTHAKGSAITGEKESRWNRNGVTAMPGKYSATLFKRQGSEITQLAKPVEFELKAIYQNALSGPSASEVEDFASQITAADKRSSMATAVLKDITATLETVRKAIDRTPGDAAMLETQYANIKATIDEINFELYGLKSRDRMGTKPANIASRLGYAMSALRSSYGPTQQHKEQLGYALEGLDGVSKQLGQLQQTQLPALQQAIIASGGPWTKGSPLK